MFVSPIVSFMAHSVVLLLLKTNQILANQFLLIHVHAFH